MKTNKEEIKNELIETINGFYKEYKIPPMNITNEEWNTFLYVVEYNDNKRLFGRIIWKIIYMLLIL